MPGFEDIVRQAAKNSVGLPVAERRKSLFHFSIFHVSFHLPVPLPLSLSLPFNCFSTLSYLLPFSLIFTPYHFPQFLLPFSLPFLPPFLLSLYNPFFLPFYHPFYYPFYCLFYVSSLYHVSLSLTIFTIVYHCLPFYHFTTFTSCRWMSLLTRQTQSLGSRRCCPELGREITTTQAETRQTARHHKTHHDQVRPRARQNPAHAQRTEELARWCLHHPARVEVSHWWVSVNTHSTPVPGTQGKLWVPRNAETTRGPGHD